MPYRPLDQSVVLWDERGKPYWRYLDGGKSYIPPITAGQYRDDPKMLAWARAQGVDIAAGKMGTQRGSDFFHKRDTWDDQKGEYSRPFDYGSLVTLGVGGMLGAGAIAALGSGAGAGAGAVAAPSSGAAIPSTVAPAVSSIAATGAATPGLVAPAFTAPLASTVPAAVSQIASTGAATPGSVAPTAAASGGAVARIVDALRRSVTTPEGAQNLMALIPALTRLTGGGGGNGGSTDGLADEMRQSLALQRKRLEQSQPVYDTLVNMAYGGTPTARRGTAPAGYQPSAAPSGAYAYRSPQFGGGQR